MTDSTYEFDLNMRPDPPAAQRGAILVTADLMGDPTPEYRRRQAEVAPLIAAHEIYVRKYQSAYAAGYRARKV
jgi:hypothetical protein